MKCMLLTHVGCHSRLPPLLSSQYIATRSFAAEYSHLVESVFTAYIPYLIGILLNASHFHVINIWFFCRLFVRFINVNELMGPPTRSDSYTVLCNTCIACRFRPRSLAGISHSYSLSHSLSLSFTHIPLYSSSSSSSSSS